MAEVRLTPKHIDKNWIFTFFGTAIGAGILFLPIQTGTAGIVVVLISMALAFVATYYSQKYFTIFIVRSKDSESYDSALASYWGKWASIAISGLWAIALFVPLTIYTTALSANLAQFIYDYTPMHIKLFGNPFVSMVLMAICVAILLTSEDTVISFTNKIGNVLLFLLIAITILFIPFWKFPNGLLNFDWSLSTMLKNLLMTFPLYNGALVFYMTIPPMIMFYRKHYPQLTLDQQEKKTTQLNKYALIMTAVFTMIFLLSASLTLSPEDIDYAVKNNVSALAILGLGKELNAILHIIKFTGYLVIFFAMITSFFGVAIGAIAMWSHLLPTPKTWDEKRKKQITTIVILALVWVISAFNINILDLMGFLSTPINAAVSFIIPTVIIFSNKSLKKFRGIAALLVLLLGIFTLVSYLIGSSL